MRVLTIAHGWPPQAQGGAEIFAATLARAMARRGAAVLAVARESDRDRPDAATRESVVDGIDVRWVNNTFASARSFEETYANSAIDRAVLDAADAFRPDVAHVHHLTCLSTTIVAGLRRRGVPVVYTLHDYWLMCHRGQLLDVALARCDGPTPPGCQQCIGPAAASGSAYAAAAMVRRVERGLPLAGTLLRRAARYAARGNHRAGHAQALARAAHMRDVVAQISWFLAPSTHILRRTAPLGIPADRISVSEYGVDLTRFSARRRHEPAHSAPIRLGFLGSLMPSKAPHVLVDAAARLPRDRVMVEIYGRPTPYHGDSSYEGTFRDCLARAGVAGARVRVEDAIPHDEVPGTLSRFDVLVVPSIWEENSPLVIREALACGVPVIASRAGGIPETVRDGVNGLLFTPGDATDLARTLHRLLDEPDLLPQLRAGIRPPRSIDDEAGATLELYERLLSEPRAPHSSRGAGRSPNPGAASSRGAAVVLNYRTPDQTRLSVRALRASTHPLDIIVVDNDGAGGETEALEGEGPSERLAGEDGVTLLRTGSNLGFAGGCNAGIRHALDAGAPWVLLVNSDLLVAPDTVERLIRAADEHPQAGIISPLLLSRGEPGEISSAGMDYAPTTGRMRHRAAGLPRGEWRGPSWLAVEGVAGCAMFVRREVFERVGLLPEELFFSFEDLAFCLRAREAGFEVGVAVDAIAFHEGSGTMGRSPARYYYAARNHLRVAAEHGPPGVIARTARTVWVGALNAAHACRPDGGPAHARLGAVARGIVDYLRGRTGPLS